MKSAQVHLPSTRAELEKLDSDAKSASWARYSAASYKRQIRALWYYIQCERYNVSIAKKHITMFRKYMDNPDACLTRVYSPDAGRKDNQNISWHRIRGHG